MLSLVSLLVAAALVSLQCGLTHAQFENKIELDNSLSPNAVGVSPTATRPRRLRKFVSISRPPPAAAALASGATLELPCTAMGKPAPELHWLKNGQPVYDIESNELIPEEPSSLASVTSILLLHASSSTAGVEDVYTCVATAADIQKTATTTVYTKPANEADELLSLQTLFKIPTRPRIVLYYDDLFQEIGTNVVLPCQVNSYEKTQIYWQDNHDNFVYGNSRMRVLPSGELMINNLRWSDMGQYTCNAKNMLGKDSAVTFVYPLKAKGH